MPTVLGPIDVYNLYNLCIYFKTKHEFWGFHTLVLFSVLNTLVKTIECMSLLVGPLNEDLIVFLFVL